MKRSRLILTLYAVVVALYWMSMYFYMPTLSLYAKTKTDDLAAIGFALSMYGLWQMVVRLPLGIAVDWLGRRKPFIVAGFVLTGVGALVMGAAPDIVGIGVGRAITGWAAATWVPLLVVFSGLFPPEEAVRASTTATLINSVARVAATSLNGSLNRLGGYELAFWIAAGAAALSILAILPIPEQPRERKRPSFKGIGRLVVRKDVLLPSILSAVNQYANWGATFTFIPILADQLEATDEVKSLMISMNLVVFIVGNLLARGIVDRIGARRLSQLGFALLFVGVGGAAIAPGLPTLIAAQLLIGLSQGIGYPVLMGMSIRYVDDAQRTTAMGLHQSVYALGMFAGPWLSGVLAEWLGIRPMLGVTAAAVVIVGLALSQMCESTAR
ncbi:MAG: MFS transporter [Anaerolineae bacterium]|nr:MFS transporter [Anaerolineae bacterium]